MSIPHCSANQKDKAGQEAKLKEVPAKTPKRPVCTSPSNWQTQGFEERAQVIINVRSGRNSGIENAQQHHLAPC